jgi:stearoyl-CoA desaturase (delta-9 desaturase)
VNKERFENIHRVIPTPNCSPVEGRVVWSPAKSLFVTGMWASTLIGGFFTFSLDSFALFLSSTAVVLCGGHSLGMHRRLIHKSFECPKWFEHTIVYLGTLVGLAGPYGMINSHDMRDWAQRQPACHDYFAHRQPMLIDGYWQLHCDLILTRPPAFKIEKEVAEDKFYQFLDKTWMLQQVPWAILFGAIGGLPYIIWGVCARVSACVLGHWLIGYYAHNEGHRSYHVRGAGVQGYNIKWGKFWGLTTFGESYHNNHHAFPGSANIGINKGELDPGWWTLQFLKKIGLVWNLKTPKDLPPRPELQVLH